MEHELSQCALFLKLDARNFHCWNYRRFVASQLGEESFQTEFDFSTTKISENFSNYSAFHHRSIYIRKLISSSSSFSSSSPQSSHDMLQKEFSMTESAIFTEPDDQSVWWYRRFLFSLLEQTVVKEIFLETIRSQICVIKDLLELESESRLNITIFA